MKNISLPNIHAADTANYSTIFTQDCLQFLADIHHTFCDQRDRLLAMRSQGIDLRQRAANPSPHSVDIQTGKWQVKSAPADLEMRRVEITGPVNRHMMINALNSKANVFMADLEDATSPTWSNVMDGQINLRDAVNHHLTYCSPKGKQYHLNAEIATLIVRPRGWHLDEKHVRFDNRLMSASLFDFAVFFYHNARNLIANNSGPYFYLPKLENHHEAELWSDVFSHAEKLLGISQGTISATVLVETIGCALELEEILYALRNYIVGMNAGRWDYLFSCIKRFQEEPNNIFPDRKQLTMTVPFMEAYCKKLVHLCHKRGAHAIGGMSAFVPNRQDPEFTALAMKTVADDKEREANLGFDGSWVAHPGLIEVAMKAFDRVIGSAPHQKSRSISGQDIPYSDLLNFSIPGGEISLDGVKNNISVCLQYFSHWLSGTGAVAIDGLMEDAATAEIARTQLWQWLRNEVILADGRVFNKSFYAQLASEAIAEIDHAGLQRLDSAASMLAKLVHDKNLAEFFTTEAYNQL